MSANGSGLPKRVCANARRSNKLPARVGLLLRLPFASKAAKRLSLFATLLSATLLSATIAASAAADTITATEYANGCTGTDGATACAGNRIEIATLAQLRRLSERSQDWSSAVTVVLTADIDASDTSDWNSGAGFSPIGIFQTADFAASFDGGGYVIENLYIHRPASDYVGLFGATAGAVITDVGVTNASIRGAFAVGGLVGYADISSSITASYATGAVRGIDYVGGLVGYTDSSITASYATGAVYGNFYVGGLVGYSGSSITASYATGAVTGINFVGGLVGYRGSSITASYATGAVYGNFYVGGLVGFTDSSSITASYSTGYVDGTFYVGGLVGFVFNGSSITASFWDTETSTYPFGFGRGTGAAIGLSSAQMLQRSSFSSAEEFAFVENPPGDPVSNTPWVMIDGSTRPYLYWQDDDGDGSEAYLDDDDDNDGVVDTSDAFPLDVAASVDTDGDGLPDDWNTGCTTTCQNASGLTLDNDDDNDGVNDNLDAFPNDPNETLDSDSDGYGDNEEISEGTDPNDPNDQPVQSGLPIWLLYEATKP